MNQPEQAGRETAALSNAAQFAVNPLAALTEANAMVGFLQNRNLLLAHDVLSLTNERATLHQEINDLVAQITNLEARIAELTVVPDEPPREEQ